MLMHRSGSAIVGSGMASGRQRAVRAAQRALSSPWIETSLLRQARGLLVHVAVDAAFTLAEVHEAVSTIYQAASQKPCLIFGAVTDTHVGRAIRVTCIATGIDRGET